MSFTTWSIRLCTCLLCCVMLNMSACSASPKHDTLTTNRTPTTIPSCANLLPGATPAGTLAGFNDIPFPNGTVKANMQATRAGDGIFQIIQFDFCFTGQVTDIYVPFAAHPSIFTTLRAAGWRLGQPSGFPYDGQLVTACRPQPDFCMITNDDETHSGAPTERLVAFEQITNHGNDIITFHLLLALPPTSPNCPPNTPPVVFLPVYPNLPGLSPIPLPPLSSLGISFTSGTKDDPLSHIEYLETIICSAGTSTSISNFYSTELLQLGWHSGTIAVANNSICTNKDHTFTGWIDPNNGFGINFDTTSDAGRDLHSGRLWILRICF
jgi:hypothetical protein